MVNTQWRESETVRLKESGTSGRDVPVEVSQSIDNPEARGIGCIWSEEDGEDWSALVCQSTCWAFAMASKSRTGTFPLKRALVSTRESASATTLSTPWIRNKYQKFARFI